MDMVWPGRSTRVSLRDSNQIVPWIQVNPVLSHGLSPTYSSGVNQSRLAKFYRHVSRVCQPVTPWCHIIKDLHFSTSHAMTESITNSTTSACCKFCHVSWPSDLCHSSIFTNTATSSGVVVGHVSRCNNSTPHVKLQTMQQTTHVFY